MIHYYTCENFHSIKDKIKVNFLVESDIKNLLTKNTYVADILGKNVSLIEAVVGPNAHGKSNVLKGLVFIKRIITQKPFAFPNLQHRERQKSIAHRRLMHSRLRSPARQFVPFKNQANQPTRMSVRFSFKGHLFNYSIIIKDYRIIGERLELISQSRQRITPKTILDYHWDEATGKYLVKGRRNLDLPTSWQPSGLNSVIADIAFSVSRSRKEKQSNLLTDVFLYWSEHCLSNIGHFGSLTDISVVRSELSIARTINFIHEALDDDKKEQLLEILRELDVGFKNFKVEKQEDWTRYSIEHQYQDSQPFDLSVNHESSGTKRMILILVKIIDALNRSEGVIIIDELDAFLHPDIVEYLIKLFIDPDTNPNKIQLLFSCHTYRVALDLDKQQIIFVEKDTDGGTDIWRLDDIKGVRKDENYYIKYLSGAYGALPDIG